MRVIDRALVDGVRQEIVACPRARVEAAAAAFIAQQPPVAVFARSMMRAQAPVVQQAALGLCFLIFEVLERSLGRPFPEVAEARIREAHEGTESWLAHADTADPAHPTLATQVLSVFYGAAARDGYDEGVRASPFLMLRTLTGALDLGEVRA